jgi:hypothetical protein
MVSSERREPARTWQGCKDGSPARDRSKTVSMATAVGARGNVEDRSDQPPYEPQSWLDLPLKEVFKRAAEAQRERREQKQRELEPFEELKGSQLARNAGLFDLCHGGLRFRDDCDKHDNIGIKPGHGGPGVIPK